MRNLDSDVDGDKKQSRNYGRNAKFVQRAPDQDESDVWNKFILEYASEVSLSTAIKGASGSSSQLNQVCNNPKRTKVCREMERTDRTPLATCFPKNRLSQMV